MLSKSDFPSIPLSEVFSWLAAGSSAELTVLTPNRRLARALKSEFDRTQAANAARLWNSADILPVSAFIERIYRDAFWSRKSRTLPILLSPIQERVLWENAINGSPAGRDLLDISEAARLASEAWRLAHAWHLVPHLNKRSVLNEDVRAFLEWSRRYEETAGRAGRIDRARLGDLVPKLLACSAASVPTRLVCYGFDIITSQQRALLAGFKEAGCEVMTAHPQGRPCPDKRQVQRHECDDIRNEITCAAAWARSKLESSSFACIGVVVPDLAAHRAAISRIFGSVMEPDVGQALAQPYRPRPFNISLGQPLSSYPLVHAALLLLDLAQGKIDFERVSLLLRSPFLGGGEAEMAARVRLDMRLRHRAEASITLDRLQVLVERERDAQFCPDLVRILPALSMFSKTALAGLQKPSGLARGIADALRLAGFPGERQLDSGEYQTLKKWQEILADFAALDTVISRTTFNQAVLRLRSMAAETVFQPETADVPIQILGTLESAGMSFDHLWVMGLSDEAWPPQPRPNPFLPVELQRTIPWGSAQASLALAQRLTDGWLAAANEVIFSHPRHDAGNDTRKLLFSPLIGNTAPDELTRPVRADYRDLIWRAREIERIEDVSAPAVVIPKGAHAQIRGGTGILKDHAACQFRSLALYRLQAETPERPVSALGPAERGTLIHDMLAHVWRTLRTKSGLDAIGEAELETLLARAANNAVAALSHRHPQVMSGRFSEIERDRLIRLALEWLEQDRKRGDFSVMAIEERRTIKIGELSLAARLDRVDELVDGRRVIIDYKSRAPLTGAMLGERPEEPQLPLYLAASEPEAVAVAFAQVKAGDMRYVALARDDDLLPGAVAFPAPRVKTAHASWDELVKAWQTDLSGIASSFLAGSARTNPKKFPYTCRNCEFRPLCRIDERAGLAFGQDEEGNE